jgi:hypothetical protein
VTCVACLQPSPVYKLCDTCYERFVVPHKKECYHCHRVYLGGMVFVSFGQLKRMFCSSVCAGEYLSTRGNGELPC